MKDEIGLTGEPSGFRIHIGLPQNGAEAGNHWSGKIEAGYEVECPNCRTPLFPVFNLDWTDPQLSALGLWERERLVVQVCPSCCLYLEPFWLVYSAHAVEIIGGWREDDGFWPFFDLELPFESVPIRLHKLRATGNENGSIEFPRQIRHQIGGEMPDIVHPEDLTCPKCAVKMTFAGIVDSDYETVQLFEKEHVPRSLEFADLDRLYFYTCRECAVIGFEWIH